MRLSLKRGFGGCGHGFSGCEGLGGLGGFGGFSGFSGLGGFDGLGRFGRFRGFSEFGGFGGYPILSLKGFSVSFTLLLKALYLLVSYPLSYPWNILYRYYKIFDEKKFEDQLRSQLVSIKTVYYSQFHEIFLKTLDAIAQIKKKILCFNRNPFMSKALRKAIMVRSKLKNKYNKNRTEEKLGQL